MMIFKEFCRSVGFDPKDGNVNALNLLAIFILFFAVIIGIICHFTSKFSDTDFIVEIIASAMNLSGTIWIASGVIYAKKVFTGKHSTNANVAMTVAVFMKATQELEQHIHHLFQIASRRCLLGLTMVASGTLFPLVIKFAFKAVSAAKSI